jgi:hypothetical protein
MPVRRLFCLLALFASALWTGTLSAHHSFAIYDFETQIPFTGTIETIQFRNPHIAMTLKHTRDDGTTEIIHFIEGAPANMLVRSGLRPDMVKIGTPITAYGSPDKKDPARFFLRKMVLEDGREF